MGTLRPARPQEAARAPPQPPRLPARSFLGAVLAPGLCQVLVVVTKEVEEKNSWLQLD